MGGEDSLGPSESSQSSSGHWPAENRTQAACCYVDATGGRHGPSSQFRLWERQLGQERLLVLLGRAPQPVPCMTPRASLPTCFSVFPAKHEAWGGGHREALPSLGLVILARVSVTQPGQGSNFPYTLLHLRMLGVSLGPPQPEKEELCRMGDSWLQVLLQR